MNKKRKEITTPADLSEFKVASATDCTGLMPTLPQNDEEAASIAELYNIHLSGSAKDDDTPYSDNTKL